MGGMVRVPAIETMLLLKVCFVIAVYAALATSGVATILAIRQRRWWMLALFAVFLIVSIAIGLDGYWNPKQMSVWIRVVITIPWVTILLVSKKFKVSSDAQGTK